MTKTAKNYYALCEAALMIALATVLGLLQFPPFRFDLWVNGGSIDFVMLPLLILGHRRGAVWSIPAGLAYGFIKCLIGGSIGWGILSVLLDYVLAYGMVGLAGFFRNEKWGLEVGTVVASLARFAVHFIAGVTIWKLGVGDSVELFGMNFGAESAYLYSLLYNGSFMLGEMIYCFLIILILKKPLSKLPKR
jgi:thiamine transporter